MRKGRSRRSLKRKWAQGDGGGQRTREGKRERQTPLHPNTRSLPKIPRFTVLCRPIPCKKMKRIGKLASLGTFFPARKQKGTIDLPLGLA
jgi:hypothetical protein